MVDINIQNGQGITQAIKAKLLNDGLITKDTKINASIWNQIIQEVQTQNNQNVQSGQSSFYSGGSDIKGAASKNFVVKSGVMELTQEAWNNICSLFGAAPKDVQPQSSVQSSIPDAVAEAETPAKAEPATFDFSAQIVPSTFMNSSLPHDVAEDIHADIQTDTSLNNGPTMVDVDDKQSITEDPYVKNETVTDENGVQLIKETKGAVTTYTDNSGKIVKKEVDKGSGGVVVTKFKYDEDDGELFKETILNPDGTGITNWYDEGEIISQDKHILDSKGRIIHTDRYDDSDGTTLLGQVDYSDFDEKGNATKAVILNFEDGNLTSKEVETRTNGKPVHCDTYDASDVLTKKADYEYDESGNSLKDVVLEYEDGKLASKKILTYANGNVINSMTYDADDVLMRQADYEHEENGNSLKDVVLEYEDGKLVSKSIETYVNNKSVHSETLNADNILTYQTDCEYDEKENKIREITQSYEDGKLASKEISTYENDNVVNSMTYDADNVLTEQTDCEYDEKGNKIREITKSYEDGKLASKEISTYENDNVVNSMTYDADNVLTEQTDCEYDEKGNKVREITQSYENGKLVSKDIDTYANGNIIDSEKYGHDGTTIDKTLSFHRDENGNILNEVTVNYENGKLVSRKVDTYANDNIMHSQIYGPDRTLTQEYNYDYDNDGNIIFMQGNSKIYNQHYIGDAYTLKLNTGILIITNDTNGKSTHISVDELLKGAKDEEELKQLKRTLLQLPAETILDIVNESNFVDIGEDDGRAFYSSSVDSIDLEGNYSIDTMVHETGHALDYNGEGNAASFRAAYNDIFEREIANFKALGGIVHSEDWDEDLGRYVNAKGDPGAYATWKPEEMFAECYTLLMTGDCGSKEVITKYFPECLNAAKEHLAKIRNLSIDIRRPSLD